MSTLKPEKLHVKFMSDLVPEGPATPRRYTLTHSDTTGNLFLSIGTDYHHKAISNFYTRIMRDEVLAELREAQIGPELQIYCHVSGGLVVGGAQWRYAIFQRHMRQVLQALRYGDAVFYTANPSYDKAPVMVNFQSKNARYNLIENWGLVSDYKLQESLIYAAS